MRRSRSLSLSAFAATALAAGCSLVNALDDVKPADDGTYSSVARPDAAGAQLEETGPGPSTVDASEAATPTTGFSPLVVGGEVAVDGGVLDPVLTVLDSKTGREVGTREKMWVAAIAHDAPRDLWYLLEAASHFIPSTTENVKLHIRRLDPTSARWTELSVRDVGPLVNYDALGVTNERLSLVLHPAAGSTAFRLLTLDTSDPAAPKENSTLLLPASPRGIVATRGSAGAGGYLNLYTVGANPPPSDAGADAEADAAAPPPECGAQVALGNVCAVRVRQYLVPLGSGAPAQTGTHTFGGMSQQGQFGYGSLICNAGPDDITVLPQVNGVHAVYRRVYSESVTLDAVRTFTMSTTVAPPTLLRRTAVDDARRLVFVVEANSDTNLHAVPLNPAVPPLQASLRHSGQAVYYDPASETVFAPFNQGEGYTFSPILVRGDALTPSLLERTAATPEAPWNPPPDLRPTILGIRQPVNLCR